MKGIPGTTNTFVWFSRPSSRIAPEQIVHKERINYYIIQLVLYNYLKFYYIFKLFAKFIISHLSILLLKQKRTQKCIHNDLKVTAVAHVNTTTDDLNHLYKWSFSLILANPSKHWRTSAEIHHSTHLRRYIPISYIQHLLTE